MWKKLEYKESIGRISGRIILFCLLHFIFSALLGIILALIIGRLTGWISIVSLVLGSVAAWFGSGIFTGDSAPRIKKPGIFESVIYLFILVAGLLHFGQMLFVEQQWYLTLLRYNIGDLPLHISYIRHMSAGGQFPPVDPTWAFDNLRYPVGMDLYNAMWDTIGLHLQTHLFFTGFILLILSVLLLHRWGGVLLVGSFFLSGSWVGWKCVTTLKVEGYLENVLIKNFFLQHFLTQRGFLLSIPLGAFVLKTAYDHIKGNRVLSGKQALLLGLMWGSIAYFHLHSFVMVSLLIGSTFVLYGKWNVRRVASMLAVAVPVGIIALGYLTNWLSGSGDKSLFEIDLGWYANKDN